jgi:hypothetical protein
VFRKVLFVALTLYAFHVHATQTVSGSGSSSPETLADIDLSGTAIKIVVNFSDGERCLIDPEESALSTPLKTHLSKSQLRLPSPTNSARDSRQPMSAKGLEPCSQQVTAQIDDNLFQLEGPSQTAYLGLAAYGVGCLIWAYENLNYAGLYQWSTAEKLFHGGVSVICSPVLLVQGAIVETYELIFE